MTSVALPAPVRLDPAPPGCDGGSGRSPAPMATIVAVLARITSHIGDALSITVTAPTHAIVVNVADTEQYRAWCDEVAAGGMLVRGDDLGTRSESWAVLHGWHMIIQVAGPA